MHGPRHHRLHGLFQLRRRHDLVRRGAPLKDLDFGLEGRDVIIVEDIVDTGLTLHYLQEILRAREARGRCGRPAC